MYKREQQRKTSETIWVIIFCIVACATLSYAVYICMGHDGGPHKSVTKKKSDEYLFNWLISPIKDSGAKVCAN